jgi:hypothetical protein
MKRIWGRAAVLACGVLIVAIPSTALAATYSVTASGTFKCAGVDETTGISGAKVTIYD